MSNNWEPLWFALVHSVNCELRMLVSENLEISIQKQGEDPLQLFILSLSVEQ